MTEFKRQYIKNNKFRNKQAIYAILNKVNNKFYIGSAVNYERRWLQHKHELRNNLHDNTHMLRSWNKYGEDNFTFVILEIIENKEDLIKREQLWMDVMNPEYNIRKCAQNNLGLTWKFTEEQKRNLSLRLKGRIFSEEHRKNLSIANTGKKLSLKTRERISKSKKGKKASVEGEKRRIDAIKKSAELRRQMKLNNLKNDKI